MRSAQNRILFYPGRTSRRRLSRTAGRLSGSSFLCLCLESRSAESAGQALELVPRATLQHTFSPRSGPMPAPLPSLHSPWLSSNHPNVTSDPQISLPTQSRGCRNSVLWISGGNGTAQLSKPQPTDGIGGETPPGTRACCLGFKK